MKNTPSLLEVEMCLEVIMHGASSNSWVYS